MSDPQWEEVLKQAQERKRKFEEEKALEASAAQSQSAGQTVKAGKQQGSTASSGKAQATSTTPMNAAAPSSTVQSSVALEPNFLLEHDQVKQVVAMNQESVKALAIAMGIDVISVLSATSVSILSVSRHRTRVVGYERGHVVRSVSLFSQRVGFLRVTRYVRSTCRVTT